VRLITVDVVLFLFNLLEKALGYVERAARAEEIKISEALDKLTVSRAAAANESLRANRVAAKVRDLVS
jgi:hypothetical protein